MRTPMNGVGPALLDTIIEQWTHIVPLSGIGQRPKNGDARQDGHGISNQETTPDHCSWSLVSHVTKSTSEEQSIIAIGFSFYFPTKQSTTSMIILVHFFLIVCQALLS